MLLLCFYCHYLTVCWFADWPVSLWFLLLALLWQLLPQPILICRWCNLAFDSGKWGQSKLQYTHTTTTSSQVEKLKLYSSPSVSLKQFCKDLKKVSNTLTIHDSFPEKNLWPEQINSGKNDMFFSFVNSLNFIKVYYALKIKINTRIQNGIISMSFKTLWCS